VHLLPFKASHTQPAFRLRQNLQDPVSFLQSVFSWKHTADPSLNSQAAETESVITMPTGISGFF